MPSLPHSIHAILFTTAEPQSIKSLAASLEVSVEEVREAITVLDASLANSAVMLTHSDSEVTLSTKSEHAPLLEKLRKEELQKELSKASAETLAVVAYVPGTTKAQIELIRGVNASYSLRSLQMRGLIEARGGGRAVTYHPTLELLEHYGISSIEGMPAYTETKAKLEKLLVVEPETV